MELLAGKMLGFVLVLTRIGAFFAVAPVFSWQTVPLRIKLAVAILTAVFFSAVTGCPLQAENMSILEVIILVAYEAIYGLALGLIALCLFSVVKLSARIIERQMGLAMANVLDPLSGDRAQPLGMLMEMIFILLFLSANGHHIFLMTLSKSYDSFPVATIPTIEQLSQGVVTAGSTMFMLGLKFSAPILAAFLLMMVVLAILARITPETNILFLSLPLRVGLGLLTVGILLPFINDFIKEFALLMDKLIPM